MEIAFRLSYLSVLCLIQQTAGESVTYRGAVVEYNPVLVKDEEARVASNVAKYVTFMELAKAEGADIIVFPENGLLMKTIQSPIPDPSDRISPCDSTTFQTTKAVKDLSCASKTNRIYSLVNLLEKRACSKDDKNCPSRGFYIYNTNVGFDRKGVVVARYSKFNLYDEPMMNKTERPEMTIFDTDFGVRFGTFTCFDILFPMPALKLIREHGVTNFVYTTYWFSELPFLTALQIQRGWAETNNVNLLASGVNFPMSGTFGSGIYNGKFGDVIQTMPEVASSKLLIADIPKIVGGNTTTGKHLDGPLFKKIVPLYEQHDANEDGVELMKDHMQFFKSEVIEPGKRFEKKLCSGDNFCCDFQVLVVSLKSSETEYTPRAIVFDGVRKFGKSFGGGVQCCGVVMCKGPDIMNCTSRVKKIPGLFKFTEIHLRGGFRADESFQMPTTLTDGEQLEPLTANKYEFKKSKKGDSMDVSLELVWPVTNLQTFGIWGRHFARDSNRSAAVTPTFGLLVGFVLVFGLNLGLFVS